MNKKWDNRFMGLAKLVATWSKDKGTGVGAGASNGIGYDETADLGYEMYKCILHKFENERQEKDGDNYSWNVHTSEPLKLTDIPFIKVEDYDKE